MRLGFTLDACKIDDVLLPYHHHHHRVKPLLLPLLHLPHQLPTIDAHHCSTTTPPLAHYKLPHQQIGGSLDLIVAIELVSRIILGFYWCILAGKSICRRAVLRHGREKGENAGGGIKNASFLSTEETLWPRALSPNSPGGRVKP